MSIASEITRLQTAKSDLKTAIEGKGVTVSSGTTLDDYADLVDSIQAGGADLDDLEIYVADFLADPPNITDGVLNGYTRKIIS